MTIKIFKLRLSSFSYKYITSVYGTDILVNSRSNKDLWESLQKNPVINPNNTDALLTHELEIRCTGIISRFLRNSNLNVVGVALHSEHIRKMHHFVASCVTAGKDAWNSMDHFYEHHNLTDEDFNFCSAYRGWQRYAKEKKEKAVEKAESVRQNTAFDVVRSVEHLKANLKGKKLPSQEVIYTMMKILEVEDLDIILTSKSRKERRSLFFLYYILNQLSGMSIRKLAKRFDKSPGTIHHHLHAVNELLTDRDCRDFARKFLVDLKLTVVKVILKTPLAS